MNAETIRILLAIPGFNTPGWYMNEFEWAAEMHGYQFNLFNPAPRARTGFGNLLMNRAGALDDKSDCVGRLLDLWFAQGKAVDIICHSNGLAVAYLAAHKQAEKQQHNIGSVVAFNGALDADAKFPEGVRVINFYYTKDFWLRLARWRPGHLWGHAGASPDFGDESICMDDLVAGHSDFVNHVEVLAPMAFERLAA